MKFFAVLLMSLIVPAVCHAEEARPYDFDDLKFSIECPKGYTAEKFENTVSIVLSPKSDNKSFKPNVTISSTPNTNPPIDLNAFFNLVLQNFLKDAGFSVILAEKTKLGDNDVYQLLYSRKVAPKESNGKAFSTKVLQVYIVEPSRLYAMNYAAVEGDFDDHLAIANEIMKSFKINRITTKPISGKKNIPEIPDVRF